MKKISVYLIILFTVTNVYAVESVGTMFNLPLYQTANEDFLILDVGHRYLDVNRHTTNVNVGAAYGLTKSFEIDAAYSFRFKDSVLQGKYNLFNDEKKKDFLSLSFIAGGGYKDFNGINNSVSISYIDDNDVMAESIMESEDRYSGFTQIVIQKNFFNKLFSLGIVPTYAHNTNFYNIDSKSDYSAGTGVFCMIHITEDLIVSSEVAMNLYGFAFKYMTYSAGIKYLSYTHTFSLWFGNNSGYSPVEYMAGSSVLTGKVGFSFTREFDYQ